MAVKTKKINKMTISEIHDAMKNENNTTKRYQHLLDREQALMTSPLLKHQKKFK